MTIRRLITLLIAGILVVFTGVDFGWLFAHGATLVPRPLGVVSAMVACTLVLLAEGHRRFDRCEQRLATRDARQDMTTLGLDHGRRVRTADEDHR